jgi:hypothetical protein
LPDPEHVRALLRDPRVHTAIPVGSRGVAAESQVIAAESGLTATLYESAGIDLHKSAGPSSCVLFAAQKGAGPFGLPLPVTQIGDLY